MLSLLSGFFLQIGDPTSLTPFQGFVSQSLGLSQMGWLRAPLPEPAGLLEVPFTSLYSLHSLPSSLGELSQAQVSPFPGHLLPWAGLTDEILLALHFPSTLGLWALKGHMKSTAQTDERLASCPWPLVRKNAPRSRCHRAGLTRPPWVSLSRSRVEALLRALEESKLRTGYNVLLVVSESQCSTNSA